jgi:crotonobetainyl-CoA:carnitine CoA-transferase CaiB-like acyl-CoA transferase
MSGLLEDVRVVEMGVWVAGPSAAGVLADWGADVIKVEPPAGDPMRGLFQAVAGLKEPASPPFDLDNRGKRSLCIDLARRESREALERLLASADVFVSNLRPDALERLRLDPSSLMERHPRIVYASITGYGLEGPDRDRAAYDVGAFWARAGVAHQLLPEGSPPPAIRGGYGDHTTGLAAVGGIMAALYRRERTGRGELVDASLMRTGIYCMGWDLGIQLHFGKLAPTGTRHDAINPAMNSYRAGDGRWFFLLGLEAERHWPKLVRALGSDELASDPRCADARERRRNAREIVALLDSMFAARPLDEWAKRFDAEDVWWAPVQSPAQVVEDPQALAVEAFVEVPARAGAEPRRAVATPIRFGSERVGPSGPVPGLGEHGEDLLRELGYSPAEVQALLARDGDGVD